MPACKAAKVPFEQLNMPDADVSILRPLPMARCTNAVFQQIVAETSWHTQLTRKNGDTYRPPRRIALYGELGQSYNFSGLSVPAVPFSALISDLRSRVEEHTSARFNAAFLNFYEDHNHSIGFHSDDEEELGVNPTIASLSFGETRVFTMRHKFRHDVPDVNIPLLDGTLLLMKGETQRHWEHGIERQEEQCGPRLNLTFRLMNWYRQGERD